MKIEHWKRIDELLKAARERPARERADFIQASCKGDEKLRRDAESLLIADARSSDFIDLPAELASEVINEKQALAPGQQIGHYRVVSLLGKGGMGAAYLAEDLRLGRQVALKLLRDYFTRDEQRVRRFEQEARAASALNHPNILIVHEIRTEGADHFIVTEFVDGETLRHRMARSRMGVREALDVAIQLASALAEAHQAGIVHRDMKPENVMLRADRLVKVLDFGLAKLTEHQTSTIDAESPTLVKLDTEPGTILGTVNYMSPEQARGQQVDARSDLFSLGVVIYEMIAGCSPFKAETKTDVLASILKVEPTALSKAQPDIPAELQRIVGKALRKDRELRYQTARDLMIDLKSLKDELEFESKLERSTSPDAKGEAATGSMGGVTSQVAAAKTVTAPLVKRRPRAILALVLALLIAGVVVYFSSGNRLETGGLDSLVILPFANANEDPNTEYLCDGIPETLINSFSQLPRLKVVARTTAFRYKTKEVDLERAGRELNVKAVLTGRVIRQGDRLIVQVDLIRVSDGSQIWGERYTRKVSDIFAVQDEISKAISDKLRLRLAGEEQTLLTKPYTDDAQAYEFYLKGRHLWNGRTREGLRKAIDQFNKAIQKDTGYALAYAGLADCYTVSSQAVGFLSPNEGYPKAKDAAMKALAIDERMAEAHASLGVIMAYYDRDWQAAEREFKHAIELNPNYPTAHQWYGEILTRVLGRDDEGITELKRAIELDPLSSIAIAGLAGNYYETRQYDQAIAQCDRIVEIDPDFPMAQMYKALSHSRKGMHAEALESARQAVRLDPDSPLYLTVLGWINAHAGYKSEARRVLHQLQLLSERQYVNASYVGRLFAELGENEKALAWLEKAYERRDSLSLRSPGWDGVNSDPRFRAVVRRLRLPE